MIKNKLEKYVRPADMGDNANSFVNYDVREKGNKKTRLMKIALILGYILFAVLYCCTFLGVFFSLKIPMLIAILPVLIWIISFFTWRYTQIEYEYIIVDGEMRMMKIYGDKNMRLLCKTRVSGMTKIAPYSGEYRVYADKIPEENRVYGVSSMDSPDIYFGIFNEDGKECALFFEATEKTLKVIKHYNSEVVITKTRY